MPFKPCETTDVSICIYIYIINQLLHIMGVIMAYKQISTYKYIYIYIHIHIWVNYDDFTVLPNPGIIVSKGNYPNML